MVTPVLFSYQQLNIIQLQQTASEEYNKQPKTNYNTKFSPAQYTHHQKSQEISSMFMSLSHKASWHEGQKRESR